MSVMEITTWAQEYFDKPGSINTLHRCKMRLYYAQWKPDVNNVQKRRQLLWAQIHETNWCTVQLFRLFMEITCSPGIQIATSGECTSWSGIMVWGVQVPMAWVTYTSVMAPFGATYAAFMAIALSGVFMLIFK